MDNASQTWIGSHSEHVELSSETRLHWYRVSSLIPPRLKAQAVKTCKHSHNTQGVDVCMWAIVNTHTSFPMRAPTQACNASQRDVRLEPPSNTNTTRPSANSINFQVKNPKPETYHIKSNPSNDHLHIQSVAHVILTLMAFTETSRRHYSGS